MKRILLILTIFLAACTASSEPVSVTRIPTSTPPQLEGTKWELAKINDRSLIPNSRITLTFNNGNAGGYAGCNNYGGTYIITTDNTLTMPEVANTEAFCGEPDGVMAQEEVYLAALWQADHFTLSDKQLEIVTSDGATTLTFTRQEQFDVNPVDLIHTSWQLMSWGERELLPDTTITLIFEDAEVMSGFAGCRHYKGHYFAENDTIHFPSLGMIENSCPLGSDYLNQEGDFTTALTQTTRYRFHEGRLELFTDPGELLIFMPLLEEARRPLGLVFASYRA